MFIPLSLIFYIKTGKKGDFLLRRLLLWHHDLQNIFRYENKYICLLQGYYIANKVSHFGAWGRCSDPGALVKSGFIFVCRKGRIRILKKLTKDIIKHLYTKYSHFYFKDIFQERNYGWSLLGRIRIRFRFFMIWVNSIWVRNSSLGV